MGFVRGTVFIIDMVPMDDGHKEPGPYGSACLNEATPPTFTFAAHMDT